MTAVCSTQNIKQTTALGADEVLDYTKTDFTHNSTRYDLILAINGNYSLLGYRGMLKPKGTCVVIGGALGQILKSVFFGWLLSFGGRKMKTLSAKCDPEDLKYVLKLLGDGHIKAVIDKRYGLNQTAEAMDYISKGHASGKVIINIEDKYQTRK